MPIPSDGPTWAFRLWPDSRGRWPSCARHPGSIAAQRGHASGGRPKVYLIPSPTLWKRTGATVAASLWPRLLLGVILLAPRKETHLWVLRKQKKTNTLRATQNHKSGKTKTPGRPSPGLCTGLRAGGRGGSAPAPRSCPWPPAAVARTPWPPSWPRGRIRHRGTATRATQPIPTSTRLCAFCCGSAGGLFGWIREAAGVGHLRVYAERLKLRRP